MNHDKTIANETNKTSVRRLYHECFNQGKFEAADELISPRLVIPGPQGGTGPAAFKANARQLLAGFPDVQFTVHELIAEDGRVAAYWTWEGTHSGAFNNIPPTGRRVRQEGMVLYHFENGQVVAIRPIFDRLGVLQQLGAVPASPNAPTKLAPVTT